MKEIDTDVIIIGAGLVGLVVAHNLSTLNQRVTVIDKAPYLNSKVSFNDTRTVAVSEGSKQFLESLSLWKFLDKYAEPIKKINVYDRTPQNNILFSNSINNKKLGYVIENKKFSEILKNKLSYFDNTKILYNTSIKKIEPNKKFSKLITQKNEINTKLVIAADGKNSDTRKMVGNKIFKKNYLESALVLNFFHEKKLNNTAYEVFYNTGPLAILPMKSFKKYSQSTIIWSNKNEFLIKLINSNKDFLLNYIEEQVGEITGRVIKINSVQKFPLSAHINDSFMNKRLIYIGDSAHSIHPIAGQGWNLGINDIKNLNQVFQKSKKKKIEIGDYSFCKHYNDLNYNKAFQLFQITDKLNTHFKKNGVLYRLLSGAGFKVINNNSFLKNEITKYAMGV
jgi:2-octaprenyl-6-methoxyphenol hydroxylase